MPPCGPPANWTIRGVGWCPRGPPANWTIRWGSCAPVDPQLNGQSCGANAPLWTPSKLDNQAGLVPPVDPPLNGQSGGAHAPLWTPSRLDNQGGLMPPWAQNTTKGVHCPVLLVPRVGCRSVSLFCPGPRGGGLPLQSLGGSCPLDPKTPPTHTETKTQS